MTLPRLAGSDTSSLSVNQYRWINFWMAILGQNFIAFPHFFDITRINGKSVVEIFPDNPGKARIFILHFTPLLGIKRRARLIKKRTKPHLVTPLPAGLSTLLHSGGFAGCSICIALACRWPVTGQCGGDTR